MMLLQFSELSAFLLAGFILAITPGNDVLYIATQSLGLGRKSGVIAVFGISFGLMFHVAAAAFGLSQLLIYYPATFTIIKLFGAGYLIYLAIQTIINRKTLIIGESNHALITLRKVFLKGALTNILNPKVALFFLAFLPQFVDPSKGNISLQILTLGGMFIVLGTIVDLFYACFFGAAREWFINNQTFQKLIGWITGFVFIGLAIKLLTTEHRHSY